MRYSRPHRLCNTLRDQYSTTPARLKVQARLPEPSVRHRIGLGNSFPNPIQHVEGSGIRSGTDFALLDLPERSQVEVIGCGNRATTDFSSTSFFASET